MFIFLEIKICSSVHPSLVCTKVRKRCKMMSANSNTAFVFFKYTKLSLTTKIITPKVVFFTSLVSYVQGVYNKPTTQLTSDRNNFINTQSHAREKPLLAG